MNVNKSVISQIVLHYFCSVYVKLLVKSIVADNFSPAPPPPPPTSRKGIRRTSKGVELEVTLFTRLNAAAFTEPIHGRRLF